MTNKEISATLEGFREIMLRILPFGKFVTTYNEGEFILTWFMHTDIDNGFAYTKTFDEVVIHRLERKQVCFTFVEEATSSLLNYSLTKLREI